MKPMPATPSAWLGPFLHRCQLLLPATLAVFLWSCADDVVAPEPATASRDIRLPHLNPGVGTAPIARAGGSLPAIPSQITVSTKSNAATPDSSKQGDISPGAESLSLLTGPVTHLLLENQNTGARALWVIANGAITNSASLGMMPTSWRIVGAGDFNGDGLEDIVWDNTGSGGDGSRAVWLMNGSGGVVNAVSLGLVPLEWHIAGAGDYDGDRKDDILWENTATGSRAVWLMNGGSVLRAVVIGTLFDWHMVAARDLNSDGKADILLENLSNGNKVLWMMSGGGVIGNVLLGTLPLAWKLSGSSDVDGDFHNDIILENTVTGARAVWLENGFGGVLAASLLTYLDPVWHMAAALVPDRAALNPNLTIDGMYVVQTVQTYTGTVPLVKDKDALLRVFLKADHANQISGRVRLRLYSNGVLTQTITFSMASTSVPTTIDQGDGFASLNVTILGASVQPGFALLADVDPANAIAETNESDNRFPRNGVPMAIDVRATPPLKIMLVPVLQSVNGLQGDVTLGNADTYLEFAGRLYPFASYTGFVRAVYTTSIALDGTEATWSPVLNEIAALQVAEGYADYNYYGVVKPAVALSASIAGRAFVGGKAGMGIDDVPWRSTYFAHELGHNWGRLHAPCGNPAGVDLNYPYPGGIINVYGSDVKNSVIRLPSTHDIMGYCFPFAWVSDYTYLGIMGYRATAAQPVVASTQPRTILGEPAPLSDSPQSLGSNKFSNATSTTASSLQSLASAPGVTGLNAEPCVVLWGRVTPRGLVLEPAFEAVTSPHMPSVAGAYSVAALGEAGESLFTFSFDPYSVSDSDEGTKMFAFAVPTRLLNPARVKTLRLSGAGRAVNVSRVQVNPGEEARRGAITVAEVSRGSDIRWDQQLYPMLVVRDSRTGAIVSLAKGGRTRVAAPPSALDVRASDRIHTSLRIPVERR